MTIVSLLPLLVACVGALVYALATNPKLAEMGRLAFFAGLFVTLFVFSEHVVKFGAL